MNERDGGPAFPSEQTETHDGSWNQTLERGMSLRDHFAGKALPQALKEWGFGSLASAAGLAYQLADAMLIERDTAR